MGIGWQYNAGVNKQRVKITFVDPATRRIEALIKGGAIIQVAVWETYNSFRWPQEGEIWTIYNENGYWHLGSKSDQPNEDVTTNIEDLAPGDTRISAGTDGTTYIDGATVNIAGGLVVADSPAAFPPIGSMMEYAGTTDPVPGQWIIADGREISRTDFSNCFLALGSGSTWGDGDGSTTFNVPNRIGLMSVGAGVRTGYPTRALAASGGEETHLLTSGESGLVGHAHTVTDPGHVHSATTGSHSHTISDPGHNHTATDSGHTHGPLNPDIFGTSVDGFWLRPHASDTGTVTLGSGSGNLGIIEGTTGSGFASIAVASHSTGITSTNTASPSVTVNINTTGVAVASASAANASAAHNNMPPYVAVNFIVRIA